MAEEGDSTKVVISDYIRTNYDGLLRAHDRLLPHYLCKLTCMGEFVQSAHGRYQTTHDGREWHPPAMQSVAWIRA